MQALGWFLILVPPFVAFIIWQWAINARVGIFLPQQVPLGKYGFGITLTICYATIFAAVVVSHKL